MKCCLLTWRRTSEIVDYYPKKGIFLCERCVCSAEIYVAVSGTVQEIDCSVSGTVRKIDCNVSGTVRRLTELCPAQRKRLTVLCRAGQVIAKYRVE